MTTNFENKVFTDEQIMQIMAMIGNYPAVMQYIGARYVPKFADPIEWSSETEYESLTVVTNNGDSYTSKKYVPTGIDISNTDYWVNTGNFNAQYNSIIGKLNDITTSVSETIEVVNSLENADTEKFSTFMPENFNGQLFNQSSSNMKKTVNGTAFSPVVSWVVDFTYIPDDVSAAIEFCAENGIAVFIPKGITINVNESVSISNDLVMFGGGTIVFNETATFTASGCNVYINGINLFYSGGASTTGLIGCLTFNNCNTVIDSCTLNNGSNYGIAHVGGWLCVTRCRIITNASAINYSNCDGIFALNVVSNGNSVGTSFHAIDIRVHSTNVEGTVTSPNILVIGNSFAFSGNELQLTSTVSGDAKRIVILGNTFVNGLVGIKNDGFKNVHITDCYFEKCTHAIYLQGARGGVCGDLFVENCYFNANPRCIDGIVAAGQVSSDVAYGMEGKVVVRGCTFEEGRFIETIGACTGLKFIILNNIVKESGGYYVTCYDGVGTPFMVFDGNVFETYNPATFGSAGETVFKNNVFNHNKSRLFVGGNILTVLLNNVVSESQGQYISLEQNASVSVLNKGLNLNNGTPFELYQNGATVTTTRTIDFQ